MILSTVSGQGSHEFDITDFSQGMELQNVPALATIEIKLRGKGVQERTILPLMTVKEAISINQAILKANQDVTEWDSHTSAYVKLVKGKIYFSVGGALEFDKDGVYYTVKMTGLQNLSATFENLESASIGHPISVQKYSFDEDKTEEQVKVAENELIVFPFALDSDNKLTFSVPHLFRGEKEQGLRTVELSKTQIEASNNIPKSTNSELVDVDVYALTDGIYEGAYVNVHSLGRVTLHNFEDKDYMWLVDVTL